MDKARETAVTDNRAVDLSINICYARLNNWIYSAIIFIKFGIIFFH
jgi:hypothetical protein